MIHRAVSGKATGLVHVLVSESYQSCPVLSTKCPASHGSDDHMSVFNACECRRELCTMVLSDQDS
jgi:hypothetical protein